MLYRWSDETPIGVWLRPIVEQLLGSCEKRVQDTAALAALCSFRWAFLQTTGQMRCRLWRDEQKFH